MSYSKQGFVNDMKLEADHLILMEDGIISKQDKLKDGVNIKTINGISLLGAGDISIKDGSLVDSSLIIFTENIDNWERKTISSTGVESTTSITQSNIMHKTKFTGVVYLVPKGDITYALVTYNNDGTFKARSSWYSENNGTKMLTDSNPFNIVVATGASDTNITISELLARFTLQNMDPKDIQEEESSAVNPENIAKINSKLKYLNFIQSCDIAEKMVHFSCDDTYNCLYDLTKNANKYTSIFDNSFFKSLQTCHNSTGACFTLNTFNTQTTVSDYNISNVPTKFQSEFQANKSWLKFAFHAEDEKTYCNNISTTTALQSYNRFVNAIYKLTGDYDCIDPITRLGFFSSNLDNALVFKNANYGIIGLLSADDTRTSYYLTKEESEIARLKGKYYDLENELIFIKTLNRAYSTALNDLKTNPMYRKHAEFFWHEYENNASCPAWITQAAQYCNENNFIHGFPSDLYKSIEL